MGQTHYLPKNVLNDFIVQVLQKAGVPEKYAKLAAEPLIAADLRETNTHGVFRLSHYLKAIEEGGIDPKAEVEIVRANGNVRLVDGHSGLGQAVSTIAMNEAILSAQQHGIGAVAVRNSTHFGIAAYYTMMAADNHMIGMALTNTRALMPPTGGKKAMLGNNPLSVAIPAHRYPPIVLDMACSVAAFGKIRIAAAKGEPIPPDWALDKDGNPTTDPHKALESGIMLPFSSYKGYGLALIIDILAGVLSQSAFGDQILSIFQDPATPERIGHFFLAINVESFMPKDLFTQTVDRYIEAIKNVPKQDGVKEIYLPGEIEYDNYLKNKEKGVPVADHVLETLNEIAARYQVDPIRI